MQWKQSDKVERIIYKTKSHEKLTTYSSSVRYETQNRKKNTQDLMVMEDSHNRSLHVNNHDFKINVSSHNIILNWKNKAARET